MNPSQWTALCNSASRLAGKHVCDASTSIAPLTSSSSSLHHFQTVSSILCSVRVPLSTCVNSSSINSFAPLSSSRFFHSSSVSLAGGSPFTNSSRSSTGPTRPPSSPIDFNAHSRLPLSSPRLLTLDNLADNPGAKKQRIRWGRGRGGGRGKTSGRGQKGMKSKGRVSMPWFEGGQTILARRTPKHGFSNHMFRRKLRALYIDQLSDFVSMGRIDASQKITQKTILDSNICGKQLYHGVKLLYRQSTTKLRVPLNIEVADCSAGARAAIEAAGGTVKLVFYPRIALRALLKPEKFLPGRFPSLDAIPAPKYHWKYQEHIRDVLKRRGEDLQPFEAEMKAWKDFQDKKNRKLQL